MCIYSPVYSLIALHVPSGYNRIMGKLEVIFCIFLQTFLRPLINTGKICL
jgi:hypothetical protein